MPRKPRFFVAGFANHVIQRGNNKKAVFFEEEDYRQYLTILIKGVRVFDFLF